MTVQDPTSKKRSAAKTNSKPPDDPTLFLDRGLGTKVIATALRKIGAKVEVHDDHFAPDAPDEEWLRVVGDRRWVVLTKDRKLRYHRLALNAIRRAKVHAFILTAGDVQGSEMATTFVKALPRIYRLSERRPPPLIARVTRSGVVNVVWPHRNRKGR